MRLLWLADECRAAGLTVVEVPGWKTAGGELGDVGAVIAHHTATGPNVSDAAVDRLLRFGRTDLPGPLSQLGLDRQGRVRIIASGLANHAGDGSWRGVVGNSRAVGVEAYNDGVGEPWPKSQVTAWHRLNGLLLRRLNLPRTALCGHREWAPTRKTDPKGLDLNDMRSRAVVDLPAPPPPISGDEDMRIVWHADKAYLLHGGRLTYIPGPGDLDAWRAGGVVEVKKWLSAEQFAELTKTEGV